MAKSLFSAEHSGNIYRDDCFLWPWNGADAGMRASRGMQLSRQYRMTIALNDETGKYSFKRKTVRIYRFMISDL